ncbi:MAG: 50S ribosomal protein L11 methyltransferase [Cyanobacteria bacterium P01_F01_bin.150]
MKSTTPLIQSASCEDIEHIFDGHLCPPTLEIAGGWMCESIKFVSDAQGEKSKPDYDSVPVTLWYPANADAVVEHQIEMGNEDDPFWCYLWPTARTLSEQVFRAVRSHPTPTPPNNDTPSAPNTPSSLRVLETGCGIGLVGLAALAAGATKVTFQDLRSRSVDLALHNARVNDFGDRSFGEAFDWRSPIHQTYDWIIASDILYHTPAHKPLLNFLTNAIVQSAAIVPPANITKSYPLNKDLPAALNDLGLDGTVWIGDPGRREAVTFMRLAQTRFQIYLFDAEGTPLSSPNQGKYQLIVLQPRFV